MSNLGTVAGTIGTVVGLGITLGALGLAFRFAERAFEPRGSRRREPIFDTRLPKRQQNIFGLNQSRRNTNFGFTQPKMRGMKQRRNETFNTELFRF